MSSGHDPVSRAAMAEGIIAVHEAHGWEPPERTSRLLQALVDNPEMAAYALTRAAHIETPPAGWDEYLAAEQKAMDDADAAERRAARRAVLAERLPYIIKDEARWLAEGASEAWSLPAAAWLTGSRPVAADDSAEPDLPTDEADSVPSEVETVDRTHEALCELIAAHAFTAAADVGDILADLHSWLDELFGWSDVEDEKLAA